MLLMNRTYAVRSPLVTAVGQTAGGAPGEGTAGGDENMIRSPMSVFRRPRGARSRARAEEGQVKVGGKRGVRRSAAIHSRLVTGVYCM